MDPDGGPYRLIALVWPTDGRSDARREYIIRLSHEARRRLNVRDDDRITVEFRGAESAPLYVPGTLRAERFRVMASVRHLDEEGVVHGERLGGDDPRHWLAQACMDMTLRDAVGAGTGEKVVLYPTEHTIRNSTFDRLLGYQYIVCRVHSAFPGSMETPNCVARPSTIEALGLERRGIVLVESPDGRRVQASLVPIDESQRRLAEDVKEDGLPSEASAGYVPLAGSDFEGYLNDRRRERGQPEAPGDFPPIYLDSSVRRSLGVCPGQAVWVRRANGPIFFQRFIRLLTPLTVSIFGVILTITERFTRLDELSVGASCAISLAFAGVFGVLAGWEVRNMILAPKER